MAGSRGLAPAIILCFIACAPTAVVADSVNIPPPLRIAVISDLNGSYGTVGYHIFVRRAVERILEIGPDLVIVTGDMVAGQLPEPPDNGVLDAMWAALHRDVSDPLNNAGIPLVVTPGNHDASASPAFSHERKRYAHEWQDRMTGLNYVDRDGFPFRFAFELDDTLFVALDVTTVGNLSYGQLNWVKSVLAKNKNRYRHTIVFSHVPIWPVAQGRLKEATQDARLHDLLVEFGVDAYLSGHHHAFYPGVIDGIAYISQPCLGSGPRQLLASTEGREPRAFTILEIADDRLRVAAVTAPDFRNVLNWGSLPSEIPAGDFKLRRADLADVAVMPLAEEALASGAGARTIP